MDMSRSARYWHGGVPGLTVGDRLLPPIAHGGSLGPTNDAIRGQFGPDEYPSDPGLVYVTGNRLLAASYASQYPAGDVYEVRPDVPLSADPDNEAGLSFTCSAATVVGVCERAVRWSQTRMIRVQSRTIRWADGSPVYDRNGYLLPDRSLRSVGVTAQRLRRFGPWRLPQDVIAALTGP